MRTQYQQADMQKDNTPPMTARMNTTTIQQDDLDDSAITQHQIGWNCMITSTA